MNLNRQAHRQEVSRKIARWLMRAEQSSEVASLREMGLGLLNVLLIVASLFAFGCLVAKFGFFLPEQWEHRIELTTTLLVLFFIGQHILHLLLVRDRAAFLKSHWFETAFLIFLLLEYTLVFLVSKRMPEFLQAHNTTSFFLVVTQGQLAFLVLLHILRLSNRMAEMSIQPARASFLAFGLVILVGTAFLLMPKATTGGISFVDALFTATSALCVTGLSTVDTQYAFTGLGQLIILALIQLGGIGIMTLTSIFIFLLGGGMGIRQQVFVGDLIMQKSLREISLMLRRIVLFTLAIEAAGAALLFYFWRDVFPNWQERLWQALFHSISAFCNAGFSLLSQGMTDPRMLDEPGGLTVIFSLVVLGGLGYPVLSNLWGASIDRARHLNNPQRLTVHTRIVLFTSTILLVTGAIGYFTVEYNHTLSGTTLMEQWGIALFQSAMPRTAGFSVANLGNASELGTLLIIFLMWIGGAPASTAGGIKVTTLAVSLGYLWQYVSGKPEVVLFQREISRDTVLNALGGIMAYLWFAVLGIFLLAWLEPYPLRILAFEHISALSTVGLSCGITPALTTGGKLVITASMLIGRLGVLSFLWALLYKQKESRFRYPTESVILH